MKHYCIFEFNKKTKKHRFVDDFIEDYVAASIMCGTLNNFRASKMPVVFCVRCLEQEEYEHIEDYSPFLNVIVITEQIVINL